MVKGLSKHVVVIKSPDKNLFEEAIFILKEGAAQGLSAQDVVHQAQRIAAGYIGSSSRTRRWMRPAICAAGGVILCAAGYLLGRFL